MRHLLPAAAAILIFVASAAEAGDVKFPGNAPVAVISVPDGWTAKEQDGALDVSSPEDSVYLGIEAAETRDVKETMAEWADWLATEGVKLDEMTRKESNGSINGAYYAAVDIDGTDKDGPVSIFFASLDIGKRHQVLFTYWAARNEQQKYLPAVRGMLRSVKALP